MKSQAQPGREPGFSDTTKTAPTPERAETASAHRQPQLADRATSRLALATELPLSTTNLRPAPQASAGTSRGVPARYATQITRPAREAGPKEEN